MRPYFCSRNYGSYTEPYSSTWIILNSSPSPTGAVVIFERLENQVFDICSSSGFKIDETNINLIKALKEYVLISVTNWIWCKSTEIRLLILPSSFYQYNFHPVEINHRCDRCVNIHGYYHVGGSVIPELFSWSTGSKTITFFTWRPRLYSILSDNYSYHLFSKEQAEQSVFNYRNAHKYIDYVLNNKNQQHKATNRNKISNIIQCILFATEIYPFGDTIRIVSLRNILTAIGRNYFRFERIPSWSFFLSRDFKELISFRVKNIDVMFIGYHLKNCAKKGNIHRSGDLKWIDGYLCWNRKSP